MFLLKEQDKLIWTASDLSAASECEYGLLRKMDCKLGWVEPIEEPADPLLEQAARLGVQHEARLLEAHRKSGVVKEIQRIEEKHTLAVLRAKHQETLDAFVGKPRVVYQAGFFDGEFLGYADFVENTADGWVVSDAKLARSAKPRALLQLGAYADQIQRMGVPLAGKVSLLLGTGECADFPIDDVLPVFSERRDRLRHILAEHRAEGKPVAWGDERYMACGRCPDCAAAAREANDVLLVAGMRMEQRRKLRAAGITTIEELAKASRAPAKMAGATFEKLRAQARLQWKQMQGGPVIHELTPTAPQTLALLPAPSAGDLFFDFEGYPLYDEGDPAQSGLEYLWGVMDAQGSFPFQPKWAHRRVEERASFIAFMDFVAARRKQYPDMHIYHYASYETTALKRMMSWYQVKQDEIDTLLRDEVFVDLYATVRASMRISADSYSIKKLEPLYMGAQLRNQDGVTSGGDSLVAYNEYRELRDTDPAAARKHLDELDEYNRYDCLSTLRLRDWLLERAKEAGVFGQIRPRIKDSAAGRAAKDGEAVAEETDEAAEVRRQLTDRLMELAGDALQGHRSAEQQGFAMLAAALNYHRLERNVFWWEHYERLQNAAEWPDTRDVFVVESAAVVQNWVKPERARTLKRKLRLVGDWAPGSRAEGAGFVVYASPNPSRVSGPEGAPFGAGPVEEVERDAADLRVVVITESRKPGEEFRDLPVALTPDKPPNTKHLEAAIEALAAEAAEAGAVPESAIFDLLLRREPRMRKGPLPQGKDLVANIVAALRGMDNSYLAIQGPPGTGKTHTGSAVIKELVEQHHWRVGVVAQSHAVVEHMLDGIVNAGLDPQRIGKSNPHSQQFKWTEVDDKPAARGAFLRASSDSGCVLGGTAWHFAHPDLLAAGELDLLIVDEAGQYSLAMTMAASIGAKRLLLLGDPQQLPQVSQAAHAESVDESALGWLMKGHHTLPGKFGYFLPASWRMHPTLCEKVSIHSYERRLQSAGKTKERHLEEVAPGIGVVEVDHVGNRTDSIEEAMAVVEQVKALLGRDWRESAEGRVRPLEAQDFLVVAPYNAQVELIRRQLDAAGLQVTPVGTVDKFQGREAPIAIVSMTASSHGDVPRGMGFLINRNRVNVAVSRAKWRAIIVRSSSLTAYMPSSVRELLDLGGFVGLCDRP